MIAIGNKEVSFNTSFNWKLLHHVNPQDDGTFTASYQDETVLSVQPDGSWQTRPKGTDGPYERFTIQGSLACFYSDECIHVFPFVNLPN